jgi:small subunit ribosomal protein S16
VAEKSSAVKGKVKEYVGHYLPTRDPHVFEYDKERIEHWVKQGAHPSDTLARLLTRAGMTGLEKFTKRYTKQKKRKEVEEKPAAPPAVDAGAADTPAEEKTDEKPAEEAPAAEEAKKEEPKAEEEKKEKEEPKAEEA